MMFMAIPEQLPRQLNDLICFKYKALYNYCILLLVHRQENEAVMYLEFILC